MSGYSADLSAQVGQLRPAVVTKVALPAKRPLRAADVRRLEVRQVPERFLPPGAFSAPAQALGRAFQVAVPAGSYLLESQLRIPADPEAGRSRPAIGAGHEPVEIAVTGAGVLASGPVRRPRVDVVVTSEPTGASGEGRTYLAARGVRLLDLRESAPASGDGLDSALPDSWVATLALTRGQALRLIHAQNFAREVRLVAAR